MMLHLEVGKIYRTGEGKELKVTRNKDVDSNYSFVGITINMPSEETWYFLPNGRVLDNPSSHDLIEEVPTPTDAVPAEVVPDAADAPVLKIEVGKFYKTRGGQKARIYATDCGGTYLIHGEVLRRDSRWQCRSFTGCGEDGGRLPSGDDIVAEWVDDPPVVKDWSVFPDWIISLAKCKGTNDSWIGLTGIPKPHNKSPFGWVIDHLDCYYEIVLPIIHDHIPIFSGDWKDSLIIRPRHEAKAES